ncbi:alpha-ketoglutarate-dependent dioxygenase AlkB [Vibrio sp. SS-MA-C1-2]|uniref:alpha-ketoglutarate-dependent dioxygenase AlkB family protein n=1 Tax=Vibrio sp. SS-MA-C1-2 TaxID=2908646 RepID=UPI001F36861E|nr:alpha-ketoglutarate-dependent dioxygenase AlkB [Vibrio sp. SS-MA-C1-2]UJF17175.1 alpha-ketoglutarate-dependent dioxygenase AlkB [Vibrio sp. SS-MA-C1-2]
MLLPLDFGDQPLKLLNNEGRVTCWENVLSTEFTDQLWQELYYQSQWQQESITLFNQTHQQPRLTCWYGDFGVKADKGYQKLTTAIPFSPLLLQLKTKIEQITGYQYNSLLLNLYRDGEDGVGYHADDESILGSCPAIASYSLGATRRFLVKHNDNQFQSLRLDLKHNDLILMSGMLQHRWKHAVAKTKKSVGPRINLTFRQIHP